MAAQLMGPSKGKKRYKPLAEINVTPFVDVMLVLLIIFMVSAPLLQVGVHVDLPKTESAALVTPEEPLVVSVAADEKIYLQETVVPLEDLIPKLTAIVKSKEDTKIYVRGDQSLQYGKVMSVMGKISASGFKKVTLVAEFPDDPKSPSKAASESSKGLK
jgi:biopolymer transport protein TolR